MTSNFVCLWFVSFLWLAWSLNYSQHHVLQNMIPHTPIWNIYTEELLEDDCLCQTSLFANLPEQRAIRDS